MTVTISSKTLASLFTCTVLAACGTTSSNMRVGTDRTYLSLKDQREANLTVKVVETSPVGSVAMGKVDASRCHRNTAQGEPSEEDVKLDLKIAAFGMGADAITDLKFSKTSGLAFNCWYVLNGEAIALGLKR
jgi:hypothetical protein